MTVIQTHLLTKVFGRGSRKKVAVNNADLLVEPGQVYGFLGPNGAGKTTTIRMLLGLTHPTSGKILVFGQDPYQTPKVLQRVGSLVEGAAFYPYLTGWDNLRVVGNSRGRFDSTYTKRLVEQLGLVDAIHAKSGHYSTGMRQRLGIVAALLNNPDLVILDEPTSGMDPLGIRDMRYFIRSLAEKDGKTVFLASHLLGEVQQICDHVAILHQGQIIREGAIPDLLNPTPQLLAEVSDVQKSYDVLRGQWRVQRENGSICIDAKSEEATVILQRLMDSGINVFSITPRQTTLESYFLELVGESKA